MPANCLSEGRKQFLSNSNPYKHTFTLIKRASIQKYSKNKGLPFFFLCLLVKMAHKVHVGQKFDNFSEKKQLFAIKMLNVLRFSLDHREKLRTLSVGDPTGHSTLT